MATIPSFLDAMEKFMNSSELRGDLFISSAGLYFICERACISFQLSEFTFDLVIINFFRKRCRCPFFGFDSKVLAVCLDRFKVCGIFVWMKSLCHQQVKTIHLFPVTGTSA